MARRASDAFGDTAEGLWSDGKAMQTLLASAQFLPTHPVLPQHLETLTTQAPQGNLFSVHEDICGFLAE